MNDYGGQSMDLLIETNKVREIVKKRGAKKQ